MPDITPRTRFYYESDGDWTMRTHYIVAENREWSDPKRLNFTNRRTDHGNKTLAKEVCAALKSADIDMAEAARIAHTEWE